jgi:hypothetical protein
MGRQISKERQGIYYVGVGLFVLGGILFMSTFVTFALHFGDFSNFHENARSDALRSVLGMVFMIVGAGLAHIGSRGLAGSGVVLNPEEAREDLEPYARMAGGMLKDALDEAQVGVGSRSSEKTVMLKCRACGKLNNEDAKFCQECGIAM